MDASAMYAGMGVIAVVLGIIVRLGVYTILVKFNRWLPEKASKVANIGAAAAVVIGLGAVIGHMLMSGGGQ